MSSKDYEVVKSLGKGEFGQVFLMNEKQTGKPVAVKIIKKSDKSNSRVKREAFIPKYLGCTHKNIICGITSFEEKQNVYVVYEYVQGVTTIDKYKPDLHSKHGKLQLLDIFQQLADGLAYMHSKGIAHRDIKDENILIKGQVPFYIDFDIACSFTGALPEFKCPKVIAGTPHYIAPEIIQGAPEDYSKADVWSLGIVFYYLLARKTPFESFTMERTFKSILLDDVPPFKSGLPRLDILILLMLQKNPRKRPTAAEVKDILNEMIKEL